MLVISLAYAVVSLSNRLDPVESDAMHLTPCSDQLVKANRRLFQLVDVIPQRASKQILYDLHDRELSTITHIIVIFYRLRRGVRDGDSCSTVSSDIRTDAGRQFL